MKHIFKLMLLPALALPLLLTSCDDDRDSNPTLDLSHVGEQFVLNVPSYATNNTYDLASAESLTLTCTQPNYGEGVPYAVRYYVQTSIDPAFAQGDTTVAYTELSTSYTTASMSVSAAELNNAIVDLYQTANPDEANMPESMPIYVRLRAVIYGTNDGNFGETFSNVITLSSVKATYVAPDAEYPENLFVIGSSIQTAWNSWKTVPPVYGLKGEYYTMVYVPAGGMFKWGTYNGDWRGYNRLVAINDNAGAGVEDTDGDNHNIGFTNGGWYVLLFTAEISSDGKNISFTLDIYPAAAYVIGAVVGGSWTDGDAAWILTAPADNTGQWVSPAFAAAGELRAYIKVPGIDWWRTEFTIYNGSCYWRNADIPENWVSNVGDDYSVSCSAGQKLYVDFDNNTAEVK